ncbi:MAG: TonB-dependent receptor plug domain-containing protein [Methylobacter sp.]|nr:TonB-dependent receptor plug domain-containing protein [Methylobacter sp.]
MISTNIYFKHRPSTLSGKEYPASAVFLLCLSTGAIAGEAHAPYLNPVGNDKVSLTSMTVYDDRVYPELIEQPRMRNQLDRDALQATEMPNLNGVLRSQGGLMLNQGSGQMPTGISLRGAGGGQGMITLDGVPLFNNFAGFYSLSHYSLDALDRVTVTRGSGGERHGSRTLGGAIHLQTRHMQEKDNFLRVEGGSYDTVRGVAGSGLTTKAGDFSAVVGRNDIFSGISQAQNGTERDNFGMTHASGNWSKEFDRGGLDASLYFVRTDEDIDGPGLVLPRRTLGWVDDKRGKFSDETWVAQLRGQYDLASYWNSSLQFGFTQDRQKAEATLIRPFSITSQLFMLDWKNTHRLPLSADNQDQALLVWGINTQQQHAQNFPVTQTVVSPNVRGELVMGAWQWSADARFDHGDTYGNHQVFSLGVNRSLPQNMSVWANGGTGYRQPGVSELMNPVFGNPTLQGEHNAGGEIGWRWRPLPESEVKVSGYYQNYRQMITMQLNSITGITSAGNIQEADVWGAEMQSQHRWTSIWESGLNYSYMDAENPLTQFRVPIRPEHQSVFWNEVQLLQPLKLRLELTFHSGYWFDVANTLRAHSAPRVNALLKYQLTSKTELYLRGENITDERTPEFFDFNFNGAAFYLGLRTGF